MEGAGLNIIIGANLEKLQTEMARANGILHGFQEQVSELATGIGAAFTIEKIGEFTFEISELAGKAHGVKQAFSELPSSIALLNQLKETTQGTVSEMNLMQFAIHAEHLNIPLKDLGELLEFAHIRALDTNKDFNQLAETLITSIGKGGRGAKRAMAELQISTQDYEEALKKTGNTTEAIMMLAKEAIEKEKGSMDETLHSIEENKAAWDDLKVAMGEFINKSGVLHASLSATSGAFKILSSENLSWYEKLIAFSNPLSGQLMLQKNALENLVKENKEKQEATHIQDQVNRFYEAGWKDLDKYVRTLQAEGETIENINKIKKGIAGGSKKEEAVDLGTIAGIESRIKELREQQQIAHGKEIHSIEVQIKLLQDKEKLLKDGTSDKAIEGRYDHYIKGIKSVREEMDRLAQAAYNATHQNATLEQTFEKLDKTLQKNASGKGIQTEISGLQKLTEERKKEEKERKKDIDEQLKDADQAGQMIGMQMGMMLANQQNFAGVMSSITGKIVGEYAMKAIAAAGAGAAEASGPAAVAAAAVAMAAMAALFSSFGISSSGGGSSAPRSADINNSRALQPASISVNLNGNFKLMGNTLKAAIRKSDYYASKTGG